MYAPLEIEIDLTAQELQTLPALEVVVEANDMVEVDDIGSIDPALQMTASAANVAIEIECGDDDSIEIELTAEQMDAMLKGK